jgi:hypothetical protein
LQVRAHLVCLFADCCHCLAQGDWSSKMPHLVRALESMKLRPGWLDGEVVMLNGRGLIDFNALQNAFDNARTQRMVFYLFDVPFYDGYDLRAAPLVERRAPVRRGDLRTFSLRTGCMALRLHCMIAR